MITINDILMTDLVTFLLVILSCENNILLLLIRIERSKANIINLKNYFSVTKFSPPKRNPKRGVPFLKSKKTL